MLAHRRLWLTVHLVVSLGWLGAVAAFLVLSIAGYSSRDEAVVRAAYVGMDLVGLWLIVPSSIAAVVTGLVLSLRTEWGLVRYYWTIVKCVLTIAATALLLMHQFTAVAEAARLASASAAGTVPQLGRLGLQLLVDAAGALVLLLAVTIIGVYKPWGPTAYGRRVIAQARTGTGAAVAPAFPMGLAVMLAVIGVILATIVGLHLAGLGLGHRH